ncbi:MAG: hypothetical protein HY520_01055 [Candidatus Aenigmarchaeota archaeon]|nr:hypothetical protein [Candidatus Aenigmarchaeota archaeon]
MVTIDNEWRWQPFGWVFVVVSLLLFFYSLQVQSISGYLDVRIDVFVSLVGGMVGAFLGFILYAFLRGVGSIRLRSEPLPKKQKVWGGGGTGLENLIPVEIASDIVLFFLGLIVLFLVAIAVQMAVFWILRRQGYTYLDNKCRDSLRIAVFTGLLVVFLLWFFGKL